MTIVQVLDALKDSGLAVAIRNSLYLFPLLEAVHVVALTLVFGTIMIVDLRILGIASTNRPYRRVSADMLKWTWGAFALAALAGSLMFTVNARVYFDNTFFRLKFALMALAGLNMLVFQLTSGRNTASWDEARTAPRPARAAAIASLVLWVLVIGMGRSVGFTTTGAAAKETAPPPNVDFDSFLGSGSSSAPPTSN
jgi:uncharacterized membrane protein